MRIRILTACTGEKAVRHARGLTAADFQRGVAHVAARERELAGLLTPAEDMYTGQQHVRLMGGVRAWRAAQTDSEAPPRLLSLFILSAGYGLIAAERPIAPYECTFAAMKANDRRRWAERLGVPADCRRVLAEPFDLGLVLLGDAYLSACRLDPALVLGGPTLLFCGRRAAAGLPPLPGLRTVPLGHAEARRFSCPLVALKGELAGRLLRRLDRDADLRRGLSDGAADLLALLEDEY
jgi:hypothetical protein